MAKVEMPLYSKSVSGSIAKGTVQFRTNSKGTFVCSPLSNKGFANTNPTEAQLNHRALFKQSTDIWNGFDQTRKDAWTAKAKASNNYSGWNAFLKHCLQGYDPNLI
jgi:hypothetical protein